MMFEKLTLPMEKKKKNEKKEKDEKTGIYVLAFPNCTVLTTTTPFAFST